MMTAPWPTEQQAATSTVALAGKLVSERIGLMSAVSERRASGDDASVVDYVAWLDRRTRGRWSSADTTGGSSHTRAEAVARAVGESVERYCLGQHQPSALRWAPWTDVDTGVHGAASYTFFLDEQYTREGFSFQRPDEGTSIAWVRGRSATTGAHVYAPASLVYVPYTHRAGEPALSHQTSVGTSCARSVATATLRATLELVERDAMTICWEAQLPFPPLDARFVEEVAGGTRRWLVGTRAPRLELQAFDLTTDLDIPVVLAVARSRSSVGPVSWGVAADLGLWGATEKAIVEAIAMWRSTVHLSASADTSTAAPRAGEDSTLEHQALRYARSGEHGHFDFLLGSSPRARAMARRADAPTAYTETSDHRGCLTACLSGLRARGHEVVVFDLTQPEADEVGLVVIRAVAPTLVRQTLSRYCRHLGNPRFREVPRWLGVATRARDPETLLDDFRPFP